uniref:Uncharacterized protein n=1 Tax=Opuntia streptacantha TaxID=393608 RepID=A0A7C9E2E1_OPUST
MPYPPSPMTFSSENPRVATSSSLKLYHRPHPMFGTSPPVEITVEEDPSSVLTSDPLFPFLSPASTKIPISSIESPFKISPIFFLIPPSPSISKALISFETNGIIPEWCLNKTRVRFFCLFFLRIRQKRRLHVESKRAMPIKIRMYSLRPRIELDASA